MMLMESLDATKLMPEQRHTPPCLRTLASPLIPALLTQSTPRSASGQTRSSPSPRHGLSDRSILFGRAAAQLQLGDDVFERPPHALGNGVGGKDEMRVESHQLFRERWQPCAVEVA
jgi:hypothetical protein